MPGPPDVLRERARSKLGTTVRGKYRLDRLLGVGGMASVFAATHRNSKRFAVKMLHPELSIRSDIRTRFLREGYAANSVGHPGAVTVLDDDVDDDGSAFLVMELLEGASLDVAWARAGKRFSPEVVAAVADPLLALLAAAHARGIVHRDVKPANVFVTTAGELKLLDFGVARLRDAAGDGLSTSTGRALGTPAFMSPEQAMGKANLVDAQSDVWAVGATMFTLLTGTLVHQGESVQELMILAATRQARSLAEVMPALPSALASVVDRALALEKGGRWPTAAAMRDALRAARTEIASAELDSSLLASIVPERPSTRSPCLSAEARIALAEGRVAAEARAPMEDHLDGCISCRDAVAAAARSAPTMDLAFAATHARTTAPVVGPGTPERPPTLNLAGPTVSSAYPFLRRAAEDAPPLASRPLARRRGAALLVTALATTTATVGGLVWSRTHRLASPPASSTTATESPPPTPVAIDAQSVSGDLSRPAPPAPPSAEPAASASPPPLSSSRASAPKPAPLRAPSTRPSASPPAPTTSGLPHLPAAPPREPWDRP